VKSNVVRIYIQNIFLILVLLFTSSLNSYLCVLCPLEDERPGYGDICSVGNKLHCKLDHCKNKCECSKCHASYNYLISYENNFWICPDINFSNQKNNEIFVNYPSYNKIYRLFFKIFHPPKKSSLI